MCPWPATCRGGLIPAQFWGWRRPASSRRSGLSPLALTIATTTKPRSPEKWPLRWGLIKTFSPCGAQLYDHFARTLWHTERSIYNTFTVAKLLMSEHVHAAGYKVVVTGEGSDELFAGYPQLRLDMIRHGMDHATKEERAELEAWLAESNNLFKGNLLAQNL
jgi:hypothetical protein